MNGNSELNRVARNTSVVKLSGFIVKSLEATPNEEVKLLAIGAASINQAIKAIIRAKNILLQKTPPVNILFDAYFHISEIDDQERTGIVFTVCID